MCLAKDKDQARIVFRYVKAVLNHIPALKSMIVDQRADEIELTTSLPALLPMRSHFWPSQGANPDDEVLSAVRPAMATIPDAKLLCISTGYAQTGALYDAHKKHYGKEDDDIMVWQVDTASMNPTISQAYIDKEIEKEPEAGRAEWLGLFREDVSAAFPLEVIEACIVPGRMEIPYSPHVGRYFAFLDPGGRHDAFTLAIAHQNYGSDKIILDVIKPHARRSIRQRWSKIINKLSGRIKLERHVFRLVALDCNQRQEIPQESNFFWIWRIFLGKQDS